MDLGIRETSNDLHMASALLQGRGVLGLWRPYSCQSLTVLPFSKFFVLQENG